MSVGDPSVSRCAECERVQAGGGLACFECRTARAAEVLVAETEAALRSAAGSEVAGLQQQDGAEVLQVVAAVEALGGADAVGTCGRCGRAAHVYGDGSRRRCACGADPLAG